MMPTVIVKGVPISRTTIGVLAQSPAQNQQSGIASVIGSHTKAPS